MILNWTFFDLICKYTKPSDKYTNSLRFTVQLHYLPGGNSLNSALTALSRVAFLDSCVAFLST